MIKSDYLETLVVGSDYLATLSALLCHKNNSSVGLLSHFNFYQDPFFLSYLSSTEVHFLRQLGESYGIEPLKNISKYMVKAPFCFHYDEFDLLLGRSLKENLQECYRKLPQLFKKEVLNKYSLEELEKAHEKYLAYLGAKLVKENHLSKINEAWLTDDYGHFALLKSLRHPAHWEESEGVLRSLTGVFNHFIPKKLDFYYQFFLMLDILSPYYLLDSEKFNHDLIKFYKEQGGMVATDEIESFSVRDKKLQGIRLKNVTNTLHFGHLYGLGFPREELELMPALPRHSYQTVEFVFDTVGRFPPSFSFFDVYTCPKWLGTSIQKLTFQQFSDRVIASFTISSLMAGQLEDAFIDYLHGELEAFLKRMGFKGKYALAPYLFNQFHWNFREQKKRSFKKAFSEGGVTHYKRLGEQRQSFTNTFYLGQFNSKPLGKISLLHKMIKLS